MLRNKIVRFEKIYKFAAVFFLIGIICCVLHSTRAKATQIKPSIRVEASARGDLTHFPRPASCVQF